MLTYEHERDFLDALVQHGLSPARDLNLLADGRIHRYTVEGDKSKSDNGWYVLHGDGDIPAGAFGSWKTGQSETWHFKTTREFTPEEKAAYRAKMEAARQAQAEELEKVRAAAAKKAADLWRLAHPAFDGGHPYLRAKGVRSYGLRILGEQLVIPVRNADRELCSAQFITPDGKKRFKSGGEIQGNYYAIGTPTTALLVGEGYATGATLLEAMGEGYGCAIAFNSGNLLAVATAMRAKFPDLPIILCADNDRWTTTPVHNPGIAHAMKAALAVGGSICWPEFADLTSQPTDFNDLHQAEGLDAVRARVALAFDPADPEKRLEAAIPAAPVYSESSPPDIPSQGGGEYPGEGDGRPEVRTGGDMLITAMQEAERHMFAGRETEPPYYINASTGMLVRVNRLSVRRERKGSVVDIPNVLRVEPVTPGWMQVQMMRTCRFTAKRKVEDEETGERRWAWVPINLPAAYPSSYCEWGIGEWCAPYLRAVIEHPMIFDNGSILHKRGYHPKSGLYLDSNVAWELPEPRRKGERIDPDTDTQIQWAVGVFLDLFFQGKDRETRFSPETMQDFAAMVCLALTALVKPEIGPAPGFVVTATVMGSGKGLLTDVVSIIKTGHRSPMLSMPTDRKGNQDEIKFSEKVFAALFNGSGMVVVDEVRGAIESATLRTMLTQEEYEDRIKGLSKMGRVRCSDALFLVIGNHLSAAGEDIRRWLRIMINTKTADPHKRKFKRDAIAHATENRVEIVKAALTLLQGYIHAGKPDQGITLGSFERWAALVPSAIHWATGYNPLDTMANWEKMDHERNSFGAMLEAWYARFPDEAMTAGEVCKLLDKEPDELDLRYPHEVLKTALESVCWRKKEWNSRALGNHIADRLEKRLPCTVKDAGGNDRRAVLYFTKEGEKARAAQYRVRAE